MGIRFNTDSGSRRLSQANASEVGGRAYLEKIGMSAEEALINNIALQVHLSGPAPTPHRTHKCHRTSVSSTCEPFLPLSQRLK
jgi:hypothetical protein